VAVDVRPNSHTFGQHVSIILDDEKPTQLYIPPGFAHGFCVLSESAKLSYKCTAFHDPTDEAGIAWDDAKLNIDWPIKDPILSEKDQNHPNLADLDPSKLPAS